MDPYAKVDQFIYGAPTTQNLGDGLGASFAPIGRLLRGFDKLGMGVPKFLSDQVLSKALLNSQFLMGQMGPTVESSMYRTALPATNDPRMRGQSKYGQDDERPQGTYMQGNIQARDIVGGAEEGSSTFRQSSRPPNIYKDTPAYNIVKSFPETGELQQGAAAPTHGPVAWDQNAQETVLPFGLGSTPYPHTIMDTTSGVSPHIWGVTSMMGERMDPDDVNSIAHKDYNARNTLTFYDPDKKIVLSYDLNRVFNQNDRSANLMQDTDVIEDFRLEGYERFNTQLIRNVIFITNLQRIMRYSLNLWLSRAYGAVSRDHKALSAEVYRKKVREFHAKNRRSYV